MIEISVTGLFEMSVYKDDKEIGVLEYEEVLNKLKEGYYLYGINSNTITDLYGEVLYTCELDVGHSEYVFNKELGNVNT